MKTKIIDVDPRDLKLLENNARYMRHEEFERLVSNIKKDGKLTSVPFAWFDEKSQKYEVLSGNHRVMASIDAGLSSISVMVTDEPLSSDQRLAIQLSHNSIVGEDDPAVLRDLYESIEEVDLKIYAGLDDATLELLEKVSPEPMGEANLDFQTVSLVFLPTELERAKEVFDDALAFARADEVWLAKRTEYDGWLDSVAMTSSASGIKNTATAVQLVLDVFNRHMTDLAESYEEMPEKKGTWVPLSPLIGTLDLPLSSAKTIKKALQKMLDRGDLEKNKLWMALEIWANSYLEEGQKA